jgi:hypothetical protein
MKCPGGPNPSINMKFISVSCALYIHGLKVILYNIFSLPVLTATCCMRGRVDFFHLWHHIGVQNILDFGAFWNLGF